MKTAETLMNYMDKLKHIFQTIDSYLDSGLKIVHEIKVWLEKILDFIEQGLDALAKRVESRVSENGRHTEEHLFV